MITDHIWSSLTDSRVWSLPAERPVAGLVRTSQENRDAKKRGAKLPRQVQE